ncbi:MAG: hypothetical protein VXY89_10545 [SAR324 cluster bacterium]|nr:hypothetical protein [SAR324 cluster bacterium]
MIFDTKNKDFIADSRVEPPDKLMGSKYLPLLVVLHEGSLKHICSAEPYESDKLLVAKLLNSQVSFIDIIQKITHH